MGTPKGFIKSIAPTGDRGGDLFVKAPFNQIHV